MLDPNNDVSPAESEAATCRTPDPGVVNQIAPPAVSEAAISEAIRSLVAATRGDERYDLTRQYLGEALAVCPKESRKQTGDGRTE